MTYIKAVLLDAEKPQQHNQTLRLSLTKLRGVFSDAEDVLDEFRCDALRKELKTALVARSTVVGCCALPFWCNGDRGCVRPRAVSMLTWWGTRERRLRVLYIFLKKFRLWTWVV
ncbi:hypothetical protein E1A91_A11G260600v1 [Gossypium mustelinum]|uniref:Disease resistance N-terminal domain-containing protein n=1 Tax=Gossypium mustelinum TaxID=34275 RepID=A0A5D2XBW8_GOSMU|nr:hypothetical protein E1A91_A11G260600v1 [Gossypium mustelinum]